MRISLLLSLLAAGFAFAAELAPADQLVAPPAVLKQADAFLAKLPKETPAAEVDSQRREFVREFLIGYTQPGQAMLDASEAITHGYNAGQAYREAKPDDLKEVLEGYGYTATEADGLWVSGFQKSSFHSKKNPKEEWFVTPLVALDQDTKDAQEKKDPDITTEGIPVHLTGFLSPEGKFGRYGLAHHQFFATKIGLLSGT